jgi:hypothetical protein
MFASGETFQPLLVRTNVSFGAPSPARSMTGLGGNCPTVSEPRAATMRQTAAVGSTPSPLEAGCRGWWTIANGVATPVPATAPPSAARQPPSPCNGRTARRGRHRSCNNQGNSQQSVLNAHDRHPHACHVDAELEVMMTALDIFITIAPWPSLTTSFSLVCGPRSEIFM